jgi:hypothetical protein
MRPPDMAIAFLENLQTSVNVLGHEDPENLLKLYNEMKKKHPNRS